MRFTGIDACPYGWFCVKIENEVLDYCLISTLKDLPQSFLQDTRIWIDMPLGLASKTIKRTVDSTLRGHLGKKSASVFTPPVREALYLETKLAAKEINTAITGKSLSEQTLNIMPKMAELDHFVRHYPQIDFYESHPEFNFKILNANHVLKSKKNRKEGFDARVTLLEQHFYGAKAFIESVLRAEKRKDVKKDDIADALCLAISNHLASVKHMNLILNQSGFEKDDCRVPIRLAYLNKPT